MYFDSFSGFPLFIADEISGLNFSSGNNGEFRIEKVSNNWTIKTNVSLDFETVSIFILLLMIVIITQKKFKTINVYACLLEKERGSEKTKERDDCQILDSSLKN